eukprot:UN03768
MLNDPMKQSISQNRAGRAGHNQPAPDDSFKDQFIPVIMTVTRSTIRFAYYPSKLFATQTSIDTSVFKTYKINSDLLQEQYQDQNSTRHLSLQIPKVQPLQGTRFN